MKGKIILSNRFYYLIAMGLSLSSVTFKFGIPISVTDITIVFLILTSIIFQQSITLNYMTLWVLLFVLEIFISNMILYYFETDFSFSSFFTNYIRIIINFIIVLMLPSLIKNWNFSTFSKAILFAIKFHCFLVIFDPLITYPWNFGPDGILLGAGFQDPDIAVRGRGLFDEPSFFAGYVGIMASLVIQYQANSKEIVFTYIDMLIIILALVASASLTGIAIGLLIFIQLLITQKDKIFKVKNISKSASIVILAIPILTIFLASSFSFITDRLAGGITGGSTIGRVVGSTVFSANILAEKPFTGIGLGGKNQDIFLEKQEEFFIFDLIEVDDSTETNVSQISVTYWAALISSGGILCLLIFYIFILGSLVFNQRTFHIGVMIFFLGISKAGVFEISLWFIIAASIGLKNLQPSPLHIKSNENKY